jgi:hypothetical protein
MTIKQPRNGPGKAGIAAEPVDADPASTDSAAPAPDQTAVATEVKAPTTRPGLPPLPSSRPPGTPPDPFTAFADTEERPPGPLRRGARAAGRAAIHEYTLVILGGLLLAVLMTWPTLRYPLYTIPQDTWDPTLQAWQMAWSGHILLTDPLQLWQSNTFFPDAYSFAFSDSLLGYAPIGMIGHGPEAAILRYNIVFVLAHALLFIGGYALVRQLGAGRIGAAVGAMAFAYAPWRLPQEGHLHIVSAGGIPLALAMLARGHGWSLRYGYRPNRRHAGWAAAGWIVATWQLTLGFGIGLPFAYALGTLSVLVLALVAWRRIRSRKRVLGWRLLSTDVLGGLIFAGVGALMAAPYFKVTQLHPYAERTIQDIKNFSPPLRGLFIAPAESRIWGAAHAGPRKTLGWIPEMTLLPGFALYGLALAGLLFSVWTVWQRLIMLAGVLSTAALSLGTSLFGGHYSYLPLFYHLPGWNGIRTPGRMIMWTTLFLGVLAAGAVAEFVRRAQQYSAERVPSWPGPWLRIATLLPLLLVTVEGLNATKHPTVPAQPLAMRTAEGPMLVLPSSQGADQHVMLWSTTNFQQVMNGGSGFTTRTEAEARRRTRTFPDAASITYLRGLGVRTVVVLRDQVIGTPWEHAGDVPVDGLGIQREDVDNAVVFRL